MWQLVAWASALLAHTFPRRLTLSDWRTKIALEAILPFFPFSLLPIFKVSRGREKLHSWCRLMQRAPVSFRSVFFSNYISKLSNHTMLVSNHLHCFNLFCLLFGKVNLVNANWLVVRLGFVWLQQLQEVIPWSCLVKPKFNYFKGWRDDRVLHMWVARLIVKREIGKCLAHPKF